MVAPETRTVVYIAAGVFAFLIPFVITTNRYYGTYTVFGSGDTIINTFHAHLGLNHGKRRWNVECLDGEAVIGIGDLLDDFQKLVNVWCKFLFPYKPFANGVYPYFPDCFVKNYTFQFYCYSPKYHEASANSFIVGFWDNDAQFFVNRRIVDDVNAYKCCLTPPGYYVDYASCYYMPTRDQYGEYYDATNVMLIYCASGYAMTGLAKKISPFSDDYHIEWIHCCRIGYGALPSFSASKAKNSTMKRLSYHNYANATYPNRPPAAYSSQYSSGNIGKQRGDQYEAGSSPYGGSGNYLPAASGSYGEGSNYDSPYGAEGSNGQAAQSGGSYGVSHRSLENEDDHEHRADHDILRTSSGLHADSQHM